MKKIEDVLLGDGVWASFDGHHIILRRGTARIELKPKAISALDRFRARAEEDLHAGSPEDHNVN